MRLLVSETIDLATYELFRGLKIPMKSYCKRMYRRLCHLLTTDFNTGVFQAVKIKMTDIRTSLFIAVSVLVVIVSYSCCVDAQLDVSTPSHLTLK